MGHDGDKPRKSWKEIDAGRDGSGHRDSRDERNKSVRPDSQAYRSYKTQLNKIFDGGGLPELLKERLADSGVANQAAERKAALLQFRQATGAKEILQAYRNWRAAFEFPSDEEVLAKLLELEDEPEIVLESLAKIDALREAGTLKRGGSLRARITATQASCDDDDVYDAAKRLLGKL